MQPLISTQLTPLPVYPVPQATVTVNTHVAVFPAKSVAVAVTVVVPRLNALPDALEYDKDGATLLLSVAVAAYVARAVAGV